MCGAEPGFLGLCDVLRLRGGDAISSAMPYVFAMLLVVVTWLAIREIDRLSVRKMLNDREREKSLSASQRLMERE